MNATLTKKSIVRTSIFVKGHCSHCGGNLTLEQGGIKCFQCRRVQTGTASK